jgi:hypothetical protein
MRDSGAIGDSRASASRVPMTMPPRHGHQRQAQREQQAVADERQARLPDAEVELAHALTLMAG